MVRISHRGRRTTARAVAVTGLVAGAVAALAAGLATAAPVAGVGHARAQVRIGRGPRLPAGASLVAGVASVQRMRVTVALKPRNSRALAAYARAVSDPTSTHYRQYLTPAQFVSRFSPKPATVTAVDHSLRAHGLIPGEQA